MENPPVKRRKITPHWYWKCPKCGYGPISSDINRCERPILIYIPKCSGIRPVRPVII